MLDEAGGDRAWLDQYDPNAGFLQFHTKCVGQGLDGEFRGAIGAAIGRRHKPEHGGAEHDPPSTIGPHRRDDAAGQIVPAEHICLELGAEHMRLEVLNRARLAVAAIVDQRSETPIRRRQHVLGRRRDRLRLGIIEIEALKPLLLLQPRNVFRLTRRGKDAPPARLHLTRRCETDARGAAGDENAPLCHQPVEDQMAKLSAVAIETQT